LLNSLSPFILIKSSNELVNENIEFYSIQLNFITYFLQVLNIKFIKYSYDYSFEFYQIQRCNWFKILNFIQIESQFFQIVTILIINTFYYLTLCIILFFILLIILKFCYLLWILSFLKLVRCSIISSLIQFISIFETSFLTSGWSLWRTSRITIWGIQNIWYFNWFLVFIYIELTISILFVLNNSRLLITFI